MSDKLTANQDAFHQGSKENFHVWRLSKDYGIDDGVSVFADIVLREDSFRGKKHFKVYISQDPVIDQTDFIVDSRDGAK